MLIVRLLSLTEPPENHHLKIINIHIYEIIKKTKTTEIRKKKN